MTDAGMSNSGFHCAKIEKHKSKSVNESTNSRVTKSQINKLFGDGNSHTDIVATTNLNSGQRDNRESLSLRFKPRVGYT